jgi:hypothetical protein
MSTNLCGPMTLARTRVVVALSLGVLTCLAACMQTRRHSPQVPNVQVREKAGPSTFEQVLEIARGRKPTALKDLRWYAKQAPQEDVRFLAARITSLWAPSANTFHTSLPQALSPTCIDDSRLARLRRGGRIAVVVIVNVRVSADGRAIAVETLRGETDADTQRAIYETLASARYLPAKPADNYVEGVLTLSCRVDVH